MALTLDQIRKKDPSFELLNDDELFAVLHNDYYSDLEPSILAKKLNYYTPDQRDKGILSDTGTALKQGIERIPSSLTGIGDMVVGASGFNRPFDRTTDAIGKETGFQPGKWASELENQYSPSTQQAQENIDSVWSNPEATGLDVAKAYATNPRGTFKNVISSLPEMAAGGILGRTLKAAGAIDSLALGAGEGAFMAGDQMTAIDKNVDPSRAANAALLTGIGGAGAGMLGAKIAKAGGFGDIDSLVMGNSNALGTGGAAKRIIGGVITEGPIEEGSQSALETSAKNYAESKPLTEGMARNVAEGSIAGSIMGGGVAAIPNKTPEQRDADINHDILNAPSIDDAIDVMGKAVNEPVDNVVNRIIDSESGGRDNAKNPLSSAAGAGQFIDSTWLDMLHKHRPDLVEGRTKEQLLALKMNGDLSREMTAHYAQDNADALQRNGFEPSPENIYLAHHFGIGGASNLLSANPNAPVSSVMDAMVIRANPYMQGKTVGQVRDWVANRMKPIEGELLPPEHPVNRYKGPQGYIEGGAIDSELNRLGLPAPDEAQQRTGILANAGAIRRTPELGTTTTEPSASVEEASIPVAANAEPFAPTHRLDDGTEVAYGEDSFGPYFQGKDGVDDRYEYDDSAKPVSQTKQQAVVDQVETKQPEVAKDDQEQFVTVSDSVTKKQYKVAKSDFESGKEYLAAFDVKTNKSLSKPRLPLKNLTQVTGEIGDAKQVDKVEPVSLDAGAAPSGNVEAVGSGENKPPLLGEEEVTQPIEPAFDAPQSAWDKYEADRQAFYGTDKSFELSQGKSINQQKQERQESKKTEQEKAFNLIPIKVKRGAENLVELKSSEAKGTYIDGGYASHADSVEGRAYRKFRDSATPKQLKALNDYERLVAIKPDKEVKANTQPTETKAPADNSELELNKNVESVKQNGTLKPLDHGELNIKGRTNNIDNEIDKYKAEQKKEADAKRKENTANNKVIKAQAKHLYTEYKDKIIAKHGEKLGKKAVSDELDRMAKWEPQKLINFVNKFKKETELDAEPVKQQSSKSDGLDSSREIEPVQETPKNEHVAEDVSKKEEKLDTRKTSYVDWFVNYTEQDGIGRTTETKRFSTLKEANEFANGKFGYITKADDGGSDFNTGKAKTKFVSFFGGFSPSAQEELKLKLFDGYEKTSAKKVEEAPKDYFKDKSFLKFLAKQKIDIAPEEGAPTQKVSATVAIDSLDKQIEALKAFIDCVKG